MKPILKNRPIRIAHPGKGQIILMVSLALFAMCGVLALAIDLGWSYFTKQAAQGAADAGALAAAVAGEDLEIGAPPYACGGGNPSLLDCTQGDPFPCHTIYASSNLYKACQYARSHGFEHGVNNTSVTVAAKVCSGGIGCSESGLQPPTAPNVSVSYWVTVRVTRTVPQLFAALAGNPRATVSARATAAITRVVYGASITLLNRQNDPHPDSETGTSLDMGGNSTVQAPGGMLISSNKTGAALQHGSARVTNTPFSYFRGTGTCEPSGNGNCNWTQPWTNGRMDGASFYDPTSLGGGLPQPPLQAGGLDRPVASGLLTAANVPGAWGSGDNAADPITLPPGNYYACTGNPCVPNGAVLRFDNRKFYRFESGGWFNQFVFYGGLRTTGGSTHITFTPGAYVFAGTSSPSIHSFEIDNGTTITDTYSANGSYFGEIFIYTNGNVPSSAYSSRLSVPPAIQNAGIQFGYSETGIKTGSNDNSSVTLHGLDAANAPWNYRAWAPFVMWQDRGNSYVQYSPNNGAIVGDGGGTCAAGAMVPGLPVSLDNPCRSAVPLGSMSPRMSIRATPGLQLTGAIYQPRGAWMVMQGNGTLSGPLKIITGAITIGGGPDIALSGFGPPITVNTVALIE